jgi:hypothetical protein
MKIAARFGLDIQVTFHLHLDFPGKGFPFRPIAAAEIPPRFFYTIHLNP